jgi:hypothetical protein
LSPAKKKADYYRVKTSFGVAVDGEQITVHAGEIVPADSKLIKQVGLEHFEEVSSFGRWDVEQATAAPGEKRGSESTSTEKRGETK